MTKKSDTEVEGLRDLTDEILLALQEVMTKSAQHPGTYIMALTAAYGIMLLELLDPSHLEETSEQLTNNIKEIVKRYLKMQKDMGV